MAWIAVQTQNYAFAEAVKSGVITLNQIPKCLSVGSKPGFTVAVGSRETLDVGHRLNVPNDDVAHRDTNRPDWRKAIPKCAPMAHSYLCGRSSLPGRHGTLHIRTVNRSAHHVERASVWNMD
jgi:hypothetical protein